MRKLKGIANQVYQNLIKPYRVAHENPFGIVIQIVSQLNILADALVF